MMAGDPGLDTSRDEPHAGQKRVTGAPATGREELRALFELRALPGIYDRRIRELVRRYGSARAALDAPAAVLGRKAAEARGTRRVRGWVSNALAATDRHGLRVLTAHGEHYPDRLRHLHDPPFLLFARGQLELLGRTAVAIVGSRRHTRYGADAARDIAVGLGRSGLVVVSGLARGIDGHAHRAALRTGTIAVLGCGIDVAFPKAHKKLQEKIGRQGLLLSEFLPGTPPLPYHFPRRNRMIAALARCVVVVEAGTKSGSLITVEHGLDLGRDICAVPGSIDRPMSAGTNALIRDGARMVTGAWDVLDEMGLAQRDRPDETVVKEPPPELDGAGRRLWEELTVEPEHVDTLARRLDLTPAATLATLVELELLGHARKFAGARFARGA